MADNMTMSPDDTYLCDNLIPSAKGLEVRKGWKFWVPDSLDFSTEVRTLMTFNAQDPANSKVFAGVNVGNGLIYDVTTQNSAPVLALTPSTAADVPGEWYWTNFVTPGLNVILMVSAGAGYYIYDFVNGWREITAGTGSNKITFPDSTTTKDLAFIWIWKRRVWFLKKNSNTAYYLPIDSITGSAQLFEFGAQMPRGGALSFGTNWTYDSGDGIDDALVIVSRQGDVLIYEGTDPANAATFAQKGTWYAGRVPYGRRGYSQYGGDIVMMTEYGMVRLSDLISGKLHTTEIGGTIATKINPLLADAISDYIEQRYWFVIPYPTEELLIIGSPYLNTISQSLTSFAMNAHTAGWCTFSNMDMLCATVFNGKLIMGTRKGEIIQALTGFRDGDSADGVIFGDEVTGRCQGAFLDYGLPNNNKRMLRVKVYGSSQDYPSFLIIFKDEYNLQEFLNVSAPAAKIRALWDVGVWDLTEWQSGDVSSFRRWIGVAAYGKKLSMQFVVRGSGPTILSDFETLFEPANIGL